ncbi:MAG: hypothetical protein JXB23_04145 [Candidatus Aminicenantes bacterium]|nr:hypothetical protein [Candidatus Aminicenantes bacterium]
MKLNTMAAVMSFIANMEDESSAFYRRWAGTFPELESSFSDWAMENKIFMKRIKRTYFGVITDAIESTFSFSRLETSEFVFDTRLPEGAGLQSVMDKAAEIEEKIRDFYRHASHLSDGLLADIPQLFKRIAQKRDERLQILKKDT